MSSSNQPAISLPAMLTVLFVALKLCGVIDWSWWWIVSPILIPFALLFGFILAFALGGVAYVFWPSKKSESSSKFIR